MQEPIRYAQLSAVLRRLGYPEEPAGYHGAVCGVLSVVAPDDVDLIGLLDVGQPLPDADAADVALEQVREEAFVALMSSDLYFTPLLPSDDEPLKFRMGALVAWCEGFLYGLASQRGIDIERCSEDTREILRNLSRFTQAGAQFEDGDGDAEVEENAYAELVEYIRVGAQLVFMELHLRGDLDAAEEGIPTLH